MRAAKLFRHFVTSQMERIMNNTGLLIAEETGAAVPVCSQTGLAGTAGLFYLVRPAEGGMWKHLHSLLRYFSPRGPVHLASSGADGLEDLLTYPGSNFLKLPSTGEISLSRDFHSFRLLYRALRLWRPSLLHVHGFKAALIGLPAARLAGVPAVVTAHNFLAHRWWKAIPPLLRAGQGDQVHYIAISRAILKELAGWGIAPQQISLVYNGIDPLPFEKTAHGRRFPDNPVVGTIARLAPQKGLPVLLRAARRLIRRRPRLKFIIIGEGPQRLELEKLTGYLGLQRQVTFLGFREDLPGQLSAIDLFVQPSLSEGLSLALLEALAAGCPVVATRTGGIPEIIEDGVTGLLVPPGDERALAAAVSTLLDHPEQGRVLAAAGREKVCRDFSLRSMLLRTAEIYRKMGAGAAVEEGGKR